MPDYGEGAVRATMARPDLPVGAQARRVCFGGQVSSNLMQNPAAMTGPGGANAKGMASCMLKEGNEDIASFLPPRGERKDED